MIGVLVCGEGTNLQALLDAGLPVVAVASNAPDAWALERARRAAASRRRRSRSTDYADRAERDRAMADWLEEHGVELVVCAGYMHLLHARVPRPLPGPDRQHAPGAAARVPRRARRSRTCSPRAWPRPARPSTTSTRASTPAPVIAQEPCPCCRGDTPETLRARVQAVEHRLLPRGRPGADRRVRALLSVYDKTGLDAFARGLAELGFELVASGGTATFLEEQGST